jgi:hypothetical protein
MDFIAVRGRRSATTRDWRALVSTEPPERFVAFGQPILALAPGRVVSVHDGERTTGEAVAHCSGAYTVSQAARARGGAGALARNHVILELRMTAPVVPAHLRAGSIRVGKGESVAAGAEMAACGNSGRHWRRFTACTAEPSAGCWASGLGCPAPWP